MSSEAMSEGGRDTQRWEGEGPRRTFGGVQPEAIDAEREKVLRIRGKAASDGL